MVTIKQDEEVEISSVDNITYLFTTKTCPNCKIAKEMLKDIPYALIDAEENAELTMKYGVMQAPTLVVVADGKVSKFANVSNIKKFVDAAKKETTLV